MKALKRIVRKILYKENATSDDLVQYLRQKGAKIGRNVKIYAPNKTVIDKTCPWLLDIGDNVRITEGVKILTHDYAWSVLKCYGEGSHQSGEVLGAEGPVTIGSNVFIGMDAIITCGVQIGDNVIIGAGSVVTKDCASNGVYAGNPAKRIMDIEEFYDRRKARQFAEAKRLAQRYWDRFGKRPPMEVFREYFMLFASSEIATQVPVLKAQMETSGNYGESMAYLNGHKPMFPDYDTFLDACYGED